MYSHTCTAVFCPYIVLEFSTVYTNCSNLVPNFSGMDVHFVFVELTTDSEHEHEHEHEYFRVHERGRHIGSCIFWRSGGQCSVFTLSANAYCGQWSEVSFALKLTMD